MYPIIIFGEWCGKGVQLNVAMSELERIFVIFKVALGEEMEWQDTDLFRDIKAPPLIRNIYEIPTFNFVLHKGQTKDVHDQIKAVVGEIDRECPFTLQLFDIRGPGEGLVLRPKHVLGCRNWFKCKGDSHKQKVFRDKEEVIEPRHLAIVEQVTYERLQSALEALNIKAAYQNFRGVIDWIMADIADEEKIDETVMQEARESIVNRLKRINRKHKDSNET